MVNYWVNDCPLVCYWCQKTGCCSVRHLPCYFDLLFWCIWKLRKLFFSLASSSKCRTWMEVTKQTIAKTFVLIISVESMADVYSTRLFIYGRAGDMRSKSSRHTFLSTSSGGDADFGPVVCGQVRCRFWGWYCLVNSLVVPTTLETCACVQFFKPRRPFLL